MVNEFFNPPIPISIDAMATHHITQEMVTDKPAFEGSATQKELEELLPEHVLVAHNAPFDIAMLESEGLTVPQYICTYRVARHMDSEGKIPRFSLQYLRYLLKLNVEGVIAHDAMGDVLVLEQLFKRMLAKMVVKEETEDNAITKMIELSQMPVLLPTMQFGKHKGKPFREVAERDSSYLRWLLEQKQQDKAMGKLESNDEDLLYTLEHYLK